MKIKIISDGNALLTRIVNAETGEPIENVTRVEWVVDIADPERTPNAVLYLVNVEVMIGRANAAVERTMQLVYDPDDGDSIDAAIALLEQRRMERARQ